MIQYLRGGGPQLAVWRRQLICATTLTRPLGLQTRSSKLYKWFMCDFSLYMTLGCVSVLSVAYMPCHSTQHTLWTTISVSRVTSSWAGLKRRGIA